MTLKVDCDVIQADGGTRTASITGAYVALYQALKKINKLDALNDSVAAVSCGIVGGEKYLDLDYEKDVNAETDANFVMTGSGKIVEIQGTAEKNPFSEGEFMELLNLAKKGISELTTIQNEVIKCL
ncbi:MAG: Ribonuclease PH [Alphaproteobacteria bacterium ADurb.Bin438]|nr:MAG: Ribonuclease PH [Alphaproteobacteria bacterium ADurb.Bin438]